MKKHFHYLLAVVMLLVSVGCGAAAPSQGADTPGGAAASASTTPPAKAGSSPAAFEKTITHAMGTTTLHKVPERVVILFGGMVDVAVALGVKPVGAVESPEEKPWFHYLRANMSGVKSIGDVTQPNLEAIIALKPDLIIGAKSRAEHEKIYPQLAAIAPTIMMKDVFDWKENLKLSAQALNKEAEAAQIMKDWDTQVANFKKKMGDRLASTEVSIIRFEKDGSSRFFVTGFAGTIFEELGLARPKAQKVEGKTIVSLTSKEQMPQLDGDYIFDITQPNLNNDPGAGNNRNEWISHPLWKTLKGVKNEKYFQVNVVTWNLGGGAIAAKALVDDLSFYFNLK